MVETHKSPDTANDRRQDVRSPVLWTGSILFEDRSVECVVLNVSANGAKVRIAEQFDYPEMIELEIPDLSQFKGKIVWREGNVVGIELIDMAKRDAADHPLAAVLLVEDDPGIRLFGARALRNAGYTVFCAADGEEAYEILNNGNIDLLITDIVMPGMDGASLVGKAREIHPKIKVICISGYGETMVRDRLAEGGSVPFLAKPFSLQQLTGEVETVMAGAAPPES